MQAAAVATTTAAVSTSDPPSMADLLRWAELTYPQYFPGPRSDLFFTEPYFYRYYPQTGNYIGIAGTSIYLLGPVSGGQVRYVGELGDFASQIATSAPPACATGEKSVETGYSGDYTDTGSSGDDGSAGDGAAGDGGYFINTRVRVELADGTVLGEAPTDLDKGMVTICGGRTGQPVRITFIGGAGAQYFDEARNQFVDFPDGDSMNVVVPQIDRNIGATAFTEAAYQYIVAHYGPDGWRNAANVAAANAVVQQEVNRSLRDSLAVEDITRLTIAYRGANTATIDTSKNGIYSTVNSGFAFAAGAYNNTVGNPAAEARKQLAKDLTDGKIDGVDVSGASVVGPVGAMYDAANVRERWLQGGNRVTKAFGNSQSQTASNQTVRVTQPMYRLVNANGDICGASGLPEGCHPEYCPRLSTDVYPAQYWLNAAGDVTAVFNTPAAFGSPAQPCGRPAQKVDLPGPVAQMFHKDAGVFFLMADGRVFTVGNNDNAMLGLGDHNPRYVPALLTGISNIANMYVGDQAVVAVTSSGDTYAWGPFRSISPAQITGLPKATMAVASGYGDVFAVLGVDGRVYTLGSTNDYGLLGDASAPNSHRDGAPVPIPNLSGVIAITAPQPTLGQLWVDNTFMALRGDGTILVWGYNYGDLLGTGTALGFGDQPDPRPQAYLTSPTVITAMAGKQPRQIGIAVASGEYALLNDGTIWRWGQIITNSARTGSAVQRIPFPPGVTSFKSLLPGLGGVALTNDGRLYEFMQDYFLAPPN